MINHLQDNSTDKEFEKKHSKPDPIGLEIFKHLFAAIADEMGVVLRKASYSPNIKERRDFSCALFNDQGMMVAQAAHIPVHLGSMPLSVEAAIQSFKDQSDGDAILLNDPFRGGTHLPDITLVSPVFIESSQSPEVSSEKRLFGFVASRAHHSDVGGISPGSMPVAREIFQEGLIIPPVRLVKAGELDQDLLDLILANVRTPHERAGDIWAQIAANQRGVERLVSMVNSYGLKEVSHYMHELLAYTERMTRSLLRSLPNGRYTYTDFLDDDGVNDEPVPITATITIEGDSATVDFTGSAPQQKGSVNAVYAVSLSAVYYVFRCLLDLDIPNNAGCLAPIKVIAPEGTVLNALPPAPVAGGNVETSQRIVDVLLGALSRATPNLIPAASQGTMNNLTIGGYDDQRKRAFAYYETIGGGMGACLGADGLSAVHSHMTNTLNTPVEALEYNYPLRIICYKVRRGSGGEGKFRGGDGIQRDIQVLVDAQVTLLSDRRNYSPYGMMGGNPGKPGQNILVHGLGTVDCKEIPLPSKCSFEIKAGDILSIHTPGGGGYGHR